MTSIKTIVALVGFAVGSQATANELDKRYSISEFVSINIDSGYQQKNLNSVVGSYKLPSDIELIGQAINFVLLNTGYELEPINEMALESVKLLTKQLPHIHKQFSYVSVENVIQTIVGDGFSVKFDNIRRLVSINPAYHTESGIK